MIVFDGQDALSAFRLERLNARIAARGSRARVVAARHVYFVDPMPGAHPDLAKLGAILRGTPADAAAIAAKRAKVRSGLSMGVSIVNTVLTLLVTAVGYMSTIPEDILISPDLVQSNWATQRVSAPIERYHFQRAADAVVSGPSSVSASATFVCNEPDDGDSVREEKHQQLIGQSVLEANGMFF